MIISNLIPTIGITAIIAFGIIGGYEGASLVAQERDENAHCNITPSKGVHACHCVGMTSEITQDLIDQCVKKSSTQAEYKECLRQMPDVCQMMDHPGSYGHADDQRKCLTWCKASHCGCNDTVCKDPEPVPDEQ